MNEIDLLNKVDASQRAMLFCVPTKMIRVITTDTSFRTFRVEQLVITNQNPLRGSWTTLSTHGSEVPGRSYQDAVDAAMNAQKLLLRKMQQYQQKQAEILRP